MVLATTTLIRCIKAFVIIWHFYLLTKANWSCQQIYQVRSIQYDDIHPKLYQRHTRQLHGLLASNTDVLKFKGKRFVETIYGPRL